METKIMDDQELLFKGMQLCNKYKSKNGKSCKKTCPLINSMCISKNGNLIFKDEFPDPDYAGINFTEFTKQFRRMVKIITKETKNYER